MATDYEKVRIIDPRLACTDKVKFAVEKGAMNITPSQYKAISATTSIHTFNINVPSQETIIAREVYWKCTINFVVETTKMPNSGQLGAKALKMMYGRTDSFAPFPLHQCVNTMTTTINNNSITVNIRELLPAMLRVLDLKSLSKYEGTTPVLFDQIADYNDCVKFDKIGGCTVPNSVLFAGSRPNGETTDTSFNPVVYDINAPTQATSYPFNPLGSGLSSDFDGIKPRGSFRLTSIKDITGSSPAIPNSKFLITAEIVEPLMMSPWLFGGDYLQNCAGIYGIANMNFQFTIGDLSRMWRYANISNTDGQQIVKTVSWSTDPSVPAFVDSQLLFTFLTPHASNLLSPVNCIPYMDLPIFKTSGFEPFPAAVKNDTEGTISYTKKSIISTSLQLNQIPDALIIFVKKSQLANYEPDWFLCIDNIQITWNGGAGYLVNATPYDLWKMSVSNGSNQSWEEFSGSMCGTRPFNTAYLLDSQNRTTGIGKPSESNIPCSGSVLYLKFGKDIQLIEDYFASGSLGNFNLSIRLSVFNQTFTDVAGGAADMVIIAKNSGIIHTTRGTTSLYTGLLTKEDVMTANSQPYYTGNDVRRMVGGGFWDSIKTGIAHVLPKVPGIAKSILGHFKDDSQLAKMGHDALHAAGYGKSGGKKAIDERIM